MQANQEFQRASFILNETLMLCDNYSDWLVEFAKTVKELKEQGLEVVPVNINIGELKKWCKQNKLKNISSSRSKYVIEIGNSQSSNSI